MTGIFKEFEGESFHLKKEGGDSYPGEPHYVWQGETTHRRWSATEEDLAELRAAGHSLP